MIPAVPRRIPTADRFARASLVAPGFTVPAPASATTATDVLDGTRFTVPNGVGLEGSSATTQIAF